MITTEIGRDGLKDSWWDAHFGWVARFFEIVAVAVLVLAVVAIILACPFSAVLAVSAAAETASTAIGWTLFGLTVAQATFDGTAMATHKESWTAFAWDIAALARRLYRKYRMELLRFALIPAVAPGRGLPAATPI